jgi:arsenical pump membrane protein
MYPTAVNGERHPSPTKERPMADLTQPKPRVAATGEEKQLSGPARTPQPVLGLLLSSVLGVQPLWIALAGAVGITAPPLVRRTESPRQVIRAVEPSFLVFVLGLGVIVTAASHNGLSSAVHAVLPGGGSLPDLLLIAALSALLANLLNNLPAILLLAPALAPIGPGPVLAALIGVNIGPNLTYVGSLATLLWRRILRAEDSAVKLGQFLELGAATVPAGLVASTVLLWSMIQVGI